MTVVLELTHLPDPRYLNQYLDAMKGMAQQDVFPRRTIERCYHLRFWEVVWFGRVFMTDQTHYGFWREPDTEATPYFVSPSSSGNTSFFTAAGKSWTSRQLSALGIRLK